MRRIEISEFKQLESANLLLIDTRKPEIFLEGFIKGSISIPFNEAFLTSLAEIIEDEHRVVLIAEEDEVVAVEKIMAPAAIANIEGILQGGYKAWINQGGKYNMLIGIEPDEFAIDYQFDEFYLIDLRAKEEFEKAHVEDAENIPLVDLPPLIAELDIADSYYVYGDTMEQAVTAGSLFKRFGFERVRTVTAGFEAIKASGIPVFTQKKKGKNETNAN
jgi:hydroxyacylglutathione hydrolase